MRGLYISLYFLSRSFSEKTPYDFWKSILIFRESVLSVRRSLVCFGLLGIETFAHLQDALWDRPWCCMPPPAVCSRLCKNSNGHCISFNDAEY